MRSLLFSLGLGLGAIAVACSGSSDGAAIAEPTGEDAGGSSSSSTSSSGAASTSSSGSPSGSSSGSVATDAGNDAAADAGGTCNDLTQLGTPFAIFTTQSAVPDPLGGTIANGTYVATSGKVWGSSAPENSKFGTAGSATMVVKGSEVETITTGATSMKVTRRSGTFVIDANTKRITFTNTCQYPVTDGGAGDLTDGPFSVEGSTLHFFVALNTSGVHLELTYEKQ